MDFEQKREIITLSYDALNKIHRPLKSYRHTYLHTDFLRDNNIVVSQLNWNPENSIDFDPRFCEPYPAKEFEVLFKRTRADNYYGRGSVTRAWDSSIYEQERDESSRRLKQSDAASLYLSCLMGFPDHPLEIASKGDWYPCAGEKLYKHRGSCRNDGSPSRWSSKRVMRSLPWPQPELPTDEKSLQRLERKLRNVSKGDLPIAINEAIRRPWKKSLVHMAISNHDDSDMNEDRLLRSELISAIYIIRDGMRQRSCIEQHAIYPVFVFSWCAFHVRVLQVHYEFCTGKLMVRKTPYIEIDGIHREAEIKLVLRWMMNVPKGETRWEELNITRNNSADDSTSTDEPQSPKKRSLRCS